MPSMFANSYSKKSSYPKYKRGYRPRRYTGGYINMARRALEVAETVKKLVNVEKKMISNVYTNVAITTTPALYLLSGVDEGTNQYQREGISVKAVANSFKADVILNQTTPTDAIVRIVLFRDESPNGVLPLAVDLLEVADINGHYNKDNIGTRFKVLFDKMIVLNVNNISNAICREYHKLNTHMKYKGPSNALTDCTTGHYFVLFLSNQPTATAPVLNYDNRLDFIDN